MKPTGKKNKITGDEIFRVEESDITFWDKEWEELTLDEIAMFCSFIGAGYFARKGDFSNEVIIKKNFNYHKYMKTKQ